jgi:CRP-like cAMP-binding protein
MVAKVDLFAGLSGRHIKKMVDRARRVEHDQGQDVAVQGGGALAFHLVLDGHATVRVGDVEVRTLGPGDYFGEISMIDGRPRSATVTVTDDAPMTTLAVRHDEFERILGDEPDFAAGLLSALCARIREAEAR